MGVAVEVVALVVSPVHAYVGRPADGPRPDPVPVSRERVEVRAGLGLVGDRYYGKHAHKDAAVTFFVMESLDLLGFAEPPDPLATRRNVILRGYPVDDLARTSNRPGALFGLDCGEGLVRFRANRPANPCAWMDVAVGPGAFQGLRGRGGIRCTPLDDGILRVGPAMLLRA